MTTVITGDKKNVRVAGFPAPSETPEDPNYVKTLPLPPPGDSLAPAAKEEKSSCFASIFCCLPRLIGCLCQTVWGWLSCLFCCGSSEKAQPKTDPTKEELIQALKIGDRDKLLSFTTIQLPDVYPLHLLFQHRHYNLLFEMINLEKADLSEKDGEGEALLHLICKSDKNLEITSAAGKRLFDLLTPIQLNLSDNAGRTPLYIACLSGAYECVKTLLEIEGIEVDLVNEKGHTPLHAAAFTAHLRIARMLLKTDPDLTITNDHRQTLLHMVCRGRENSQGHTVTQDHARIRSTLCQELCSRKAIEVNAKDTHGYTALHNACQYGWEGCIPHLLTAGADPNILDNKKRTPLHHLAINSQKLSEDQQNALAQELSKTKIDLTVQDHRNMTAIDYLKQAGRTKVIATLRAAFGGEDQKQGQVQASSAAPSQAPAVGQTG